jgi:mannose/fructose/N-acetylgalactosamine-specific phosphotransferase system component IID
MALSTSEARRLALRSLLLQVLLNYRTMQGGGYLFALWPWLRSSKIEGTRVKTCGDYLNAHPVMASLAIGALRRQVEDGVDERDPEGFRLWQSSLCGPLGTVGDTLIWDRWKPLVFATGALILLGLQSTAAWWTVAAVGLLLYNLPLWYARIWGVREGYRLGGSVLEALSHPLFGRLRASLNLAGAVVAGLLIAAGLLSTSHTGTLAPIQYLLAFAVMIGAARLRWPVTWSLLLALAVPLLLTFWLVP